MYEELSRVVSTRYGMPSIVAFCRASTSVRAATSRASSETASAADGPLSLLIATTLPARIQDLHVAEGAPALGRGWHVDAVGDGHGEVDLLGA